MSSRIVAAAVLSGLSRLEQMTAQINEMSWGPWQGYNVPLGSRLAYKCGR